MIGLYKITYHSFNLRHKLFCSNVSFRYQSKLILPVSSQFRRFYYIRKYRDQLHSILCRNHLLFLTLYESVFYQFFNNVSSGGRCAKSFSLHFIAHILCSGSLHGGQQAVLSVMFWRLCEMLGNLCLLHCNHHALTKLRQLLFFLCIRFILCGFIGIFEEILKFLPSIFPHFLAGYLKYSIVAGNHCLCGIINVLLPGRTQQTVCTKGKYLHFALRDCL